MWSTTRSSMSSRRRSACSSIAEPIPITTERCWTGSIRRRSMRDNRGGSLRTSQASSTEQRRATVSETTWRKSSHSGGGNGGCIEVAWRKSSYSGGGNGDCVEVAVTSSEVGVRDSKNTTGPTLTFLVDQWRAFLGKHD